MSIRSFDVFDTLIARRCIDPRVVFSTVAARASLPTFHDHRVAAELEVGGSEYTIDTIYQQLGRRLGLGRTTLDALKQMELQVERDEVIPIAENMALVRDGDVLVSDMYLPVDFIRELLDIAGLKRNVEIVVSSYGKGHGTVWPRLLAKADIECHLGDNAWSDIRSPRRHGISARLTTLHRPTRMESSLMQAGLVQTGDSAAKCDSPPGHMTN